MALVEQKIIDKVAYLTLNRPQALNALNAALIDDLMNILKELDANQDIGCIVLMGTKKAFVAGADIKEMLPKSFSDHQDHELFIFGIQQISTIRTPIIASVAGYALGGGCELAMACDFIIAAENAEFGQPEIKLGTLPGLGGTQRLTRAIGKAKAMDMVLTGRSISAQEAEKAGLVSRIVPLDQLFEETACAAQAIAGYSRPAVRLAKKSLNAAFETTLSQGLETERSFFEASFALIDREEGMNAFIEKRRPKWKNC